MTPPLDDHPGGPHAAAPTRPRALVVDDDSANVLFLRTLLNWDGFDVVEADNGAEAIERFQSSSPDIVFMDVMMPHMDGYEATRQIKALAGDAFVPVIFLTALSDDESLARCVEVGGDDFLTKPFNQIIFRSKIASWQRVRELHQRIAQQREVLRVLNIRRDRDDELARQVYDSALAGNQSVLEQVRHFLLPAATFSGDFILARHRPDGGLNLMLGDFTGHGLAAALGAIPVSEVFRSMTSKGFGAREILIQIHRKLGRLLPGDKFLSALFVSISQNLCDIEVWNGGMPDLLLVDGVTGQIRHCVSSCNLPLGILPDTTAIDTCVRLQANPGDHLVFWSDGLVEARNAAGEEFGEERVHALVAAGADEPDLATTVRSALDSFCGVCLPEDDVSFVDLQLSAAILSPEVLPATPAEHVAHAAIGKLAWHWLLELHAPALRSMDPVPQVISQLQDIPGFRQHQAEFFTVLSELYSNALYHGVLRLDSSLKNSSLGFDHFHNLSGERLAQLQEGNVKIEIDYQPLSAGGQLRLLVTDSGDGFDPRTLTPPAQHGSAFSGRGIALVQRLCQSLRFLGNGNQVEAVYVWIQ